MMHPSAAPIPNAAVRALGGVRKGLLCQMPPIARRLLSGSMRQCARWVAWRAATDLVIRRSEPADFGLRLLAAL